MQQESIYNIIPKQHITIPKGPLYKSRYPHNIPPTGSTFCHKTTSKPGVSNLSGQFNKGLEAHTEYGQAKTFGHLKNTRRPSPQNFTRKHTGTMGNEELPQARPFSYDCRFKKAPVPKKNEKPVYGLKSQKNFIVSNAIQNILSSTKKKPEEIDWLKKKDFGRTPQYLQKIKQNVQNEYKTIQRLHKQNQEQKKLLPQEQVSSLIEGLKKQWNQLNKQYQNITHIRLIDTVGLKRKKQSLQQQMAQIQNDIRKLKKRYVLILDES